MVKSLKKAVLFFVLTVCILSVGGAYAIWVYPLNGNVADFQAGKGIVVNTFEYIEGDNDMVTGEVLVTERFVAELNKMISDDTTTALDEIFEERKSKGSSWYPINELAADDPASEGVQFKNLLGLDDFPELTVIVKFTSGSPGYELFTTRVDVDAKDQNGEYIIPEEEFELQTTFIYPVNRITFTTDAEGNYVADTAYVCYSRAIYYYETPTSQTTTRTYDVSTWAEGNSFDTAVPMENEIIGKEITVQNIDRQKEVYFEFSVGGFRGASEGVYNFTTTTQGLTATIYNSSGQDVTGTELTGSGWSSATYYLKLTYQASGEPTDFKFTVSPQ